MQCDFNAWWGQMLSKFSKYWLIDRLSHWLVYAFYWRVNNKGYSPSNEIVGWLWMNCIWWDGEAVKIILQMILTSRKTDRNKEKPVRLTNWSVAYPWNTLIECVVFVMWSCFNCPHAKWLGIAVTFYTCMWEMCSSRLSTFLRCYLVFRAHPNKSRSTILITSWLVPSKSFVIHQSSYHYTFYAYSLSYWQHDSIIETALVIAVGTRTWLTFRHHASYI